MDNRPRDVAEPLQPALPEFYSQQYGSFADEVYAAVRRESGGEDIGQNSWHTAEEHDRFRSWLDLDSAARLLDVASGSGGPTLRMARLAGCHVVGIDIQAQGIAVATTAAEQAGLAERAQFIRHDASQPLPFSDATFDALLCIDAINHLPDRPAILRKWWRVLKPGGRLVFTDPIIATGPLSNEEIAIRAAIGFFLFVPLGYDEWVLAEAGFDVETAEDRTADIALVASRWHDARAKREAVLREIEGDAHFTKQQTFLAMCARLAREGRLSRFAYLARKPVGSISG
jgi:SAM-dependent methyltransferase